MHAALAAATDAQVDPDRRAWHLAAAAVETDEAVAVELEQSADRAAARGGVAAAAAFLQRSVELTRDPARRTDRALAAAQAGIEAGAFETALGLLAAAEADVLDEFGRARVDLLHAEAAFAQQRGSDAPPLLLRAARTLESLDVRLARDTYLDAWSAALFAGRLATPASLREVSQAARAAPRPEGSPRGSDRLLDGFALLFTEGRGSAVPVLEQAATAFSGDDTSAEEVLRWGWLATAGAAVVWDFETCVATATRQVEVARAAGALAVLAVGVNVLGQVAALAGDFAQATFAEGGGGRGPGGDRHPRCALRRVGAGRVARTAGRGVSTDRRHGRERDRRGSGHRCPVRALGQVGHPERCRPVRRGVRGGRAGQ